MRESDIRKQLANKPLTIGPLIISAENDPLMVRASWNSLSRSFLLEISSRWTPKILREAAYRIKMIAAEKGKDPLLLVPYLSEEALAELDRIGVSGIDLCGNATIQVPGKVSVYRSGAPNLFTTSAPIKNIYRNNTAVIARLFLAVPRFATVTDIVAELTKRSPFGAAPTLPTVSKAVKSLEEDLIIGRNGSETTLLQPEKLLEKLLENYRPTTGDRSIRWKLPADAGSSSFSGQLKKAFDARTATMISGLSSTGRYAVMQREEAVTLYTADRDRLCELLPGAPTERFPNLLIAEEGSMSVYFDARAEKGMQWSSPVQCYLELMRGDGRDKDTAAQVKKYIFEEARRKTA